MLLVDHEREDRVPRIGVIGVGAFGVAHVRAYQAAGVQVVGVADTDGARARKVAAEFEVPYSADSGFALIDDLAPEAVSIVTVADSHMELARYAALRGCRVLLEKPVATSAAQLADLPAAAAELILPGHVLRFDPVHRRLHEHVSAGAIGRVTAISASRNRASWHVNRYPDSHPALLTAVHDIDLAVWITGSTATSVSALQVDAAGTGRSDVVFAQITAADGSIWSIRTAWTLPDDAGPADLFEVFGTGGVATVRVDAGGSSLTLPGPEHQVMHCPPAESPGLTEEIDYFLMLIGERRPPEIVTMAQAGHVVAVAEAMINSARRLGAVVAPADPTSP